MSHKTDFTNFTKLNATQKNAIDLCGNGFIEGLKAQNLRVSEQEYWRRVNEKLNIPDTEAQRIRESQEKDRLLQNKTLIETKERYDWKINIYELPNSEIYGKKYIAEATKDSQVLTNTISGGWGSSIKEIYENICGVIGNYEGQKNEQIERDIAYAQYYKVLKYIYLIFLYLEGWDEYLGYKRDEKSKENFFSIKSYIGLNFGTLDELEKEGLLKPHQRGSKKYSRIYAELTKSGIKTVRDVLKTINLDGVEPLLKQREYHEEYIAYESMYDLISEDDDEDD